MNRPGWPAIGLFCGLALACGRSSNQTETSTEVPGDSTGGRASSGGRSAASGAPSNAGRNAGGATAGGETGDAGDAGDTGSPDGPTLGFVELDGTPLYTRVPRLTASQWEHAVTDILRFPEAKNLSKAFPGPSSGVSDFDNNEKLHFVDSTNILDFETAAEEAAALATGSPEALAALYDGTDAAGFVRSLGLRAFRRPLTEAEEAAYGAVFARGEELYGTGFANGAALVIRAMLQSPHFLYRTELGPAGEALNAYEVASKLSFFLLDTTPSDALLEAAAGGELDTAEGLEAAARDMLDAPAAVAVLRNFHRQLLALEEPAAFDELSAASSAFFDHVFENNLGLREFLTSNEAFAGAELAPVYGVSAPASGVELRELGPSRSGYFMQVPFLTRSAQGARSNPSQRGFRLERMLCGPRPASHDTAVDVPAQTSAQTTRDHVAAVTETCGGTCHAAIDPLGFALENFDGLGRERDVDNGLPVDTAGSYPFAEGNQAFGDGNELMRIMADSLQVHTCYSKNVTGYALGRDVAPSDRPLLERLGSESLEHSLRELVLALIRDEAFRFRPEVAP